MSGQLNQPSVTRRRFVQTLGVSAIGLALAACAPPSSSSSPPSGAAPAQPQATTAPAVVAGTGAFSGTSIRFGALANYKGDALEKTFPDFEKATGIKVQIDKLPNPNLADKLAVSFASGSPDYDVAMMDETWIAGLAPYLTNVDALVTRDNIDLKQYVPNGLSAGVYNSTRVAMPLDPNVMMLLYRKDLFTAKNVAAPVTLPVGSTAPRSLPPRPPQTPWS